jgi:hypothetical protein
VQQLPRLQAPSPNYRQRSFNPSSPTPQASAVSPACSALRISLKSPQNLLASLPAAAITISTSPGPPRASALATPTTDGPYDPYVLLSLKYTILTAQSPMNQAVSWFCGCVITPRQLLLSLALILISALSRPSPLPPLPPLTLLYRCLQISRLQNIAIAL